MNKIIINIHIQDLYELKFFFLLGKFLAMRSVSCMVNIDLTILENAKAYSRGVIVPFCLSMSKA